MDFAEEKLIENVKRPVNSFEFSQKRQRTKSPCGEKNTPKVRSKSQEIEENTAKSHQQDEVGLNF